MLHGIRLLQWRRNWAWRQRPQFTSWSMLQASPMFMNWYRPKEWNPRKKNISSQNDCVSRTSFCNMPMMASWPIVSAPDPCGWWAHTAAVRVVIRPREWDHSGRNVYFTGWPGGSDWICRSFLLKAVIWSGLGIILEFFLVNPSNWKEALVHTQSTVEVWHYPICPDNCQNICLQCSFANHGNFAVLTGCLG